MGIRDQLEKYKAARAKVEGHPMAATFKIDRQYLVVTYPPGFSVDGIRVSCAKGQTNACELALTRMEKEWMNSYPAGAQNGI